MLMINKIDWSKRAKKKKFVKYFIKLFTAL